MGGLARRRDNAQMRKTSRWAVGGLNGATRMAAIGVVVTASVLVAGCGQGRSAGPAGSSVPTPPTALPTPSPAATASPSQSPPATGHSAAAMSVQVSRTGGIAGLNQLVMFAPDGSWKFTDRKTGTSSTGQLTSAQRSQLTRLVTDPDLANEARQSPSVGCADGFVWVVTAGDLSIRHDQCMTGNHKAIDAVLAFVTDVTPL